MTHYLVHCPSNKCTFAASLYDDGYWYIAGTNGRVKVDSVVSHWREIPKGPNV